MIEMTGTTGTIDIVTLMPSTHDIVRTRMETGGVGRAIGIAKSSMLIKMPGIEAITGM